MSRNFINRDTMEVLSEQDFHKKVERKLTKKYHEMKKNDTLDFPSMTLEEFLYNRIDVNGLEFVYDNWYFED